MRIARVLHNSQSFHCVVESEYVYRISGCIFNKYDVPNEPINIGECTLLPPVIPGNFYAAGFNYSRHKGEYAMFYKATVAGELRADIGYRSNNALIGCGDSIVIPRGSAGPVQYEPELVVIIGKRVKHVSEEDALACVFGYTIGNDVSERSFQKSDRTLWRAKNSDTFKPMGPWIETDAKLDKIVTTVVLNGRRVSEFKTNAMLIGIERYISIITEYITLHPGDVIWMGAESPTLDISPGDSVSIEISEIGVLTNPVTAAI